LQQLGEGTLKPEFDRSVIPQFSEVII
jgi:hypothetical protein